MRVTNGMITSSAQYQINKAKNQMLTAENQYTTQKKIQRPSDDPSIAVRTLQLRTTYSQLYQYQEKNVLDAMSWMDATDTALKNIDNLLYYMKSYFVQGSQDVLGTEERQSVLSALKQYASAIYEDEANTDYSGRYIFTGYRTDTSLLFPEDTTNLEYEITENFSKTDIDKISYVYGGPSYSEGATADDYAAMVPTLDYAYRLQLSYKNCSDSGITDGGTLAVDTAIAITLTDASGNVLTDASGNDIGTLTVATISSEELAASGMSYEEYMESYNDSSGCDAIYLYDTGEVIFSSDAYKTIQANDATITVTYCKKEFDKSDVRPEMYFACTSYNTDSAKVVNYADPAGQDIEYEINQSQTIKVNTQACDAIGMDILRVIDYLEETINSVDACEKQIASVETMIANAGEDDDVDALEKLVEVLNDELDLLNSCMQEAFGMGLTVVDEVESKLNVAYADLGARYNRVQMTYNKLLDQTIDTEQRLSDTEDIDLADAYINLTEAYNLYDAALAATAKILGTSLLDYI